MRDSGSSLFEVAQVGRPGQSGNGPESTAPAPSFGWHWIRSDLARGRNGKTRRRGMRAQSAPRDFPFEKSPLGPDQARSRDCALEQRGRPRRGSSSPRTRQEDTLTLVRLSRKSRFRGNPKNAEDFSQRRRDRRSSQRRGEGGTAPYEGRPRPLFSQVKRPTDEDVRRTFRGGMSKGVASRRMRCSSLLWRSAIRDQR